MEAERTVWIDLGRGLAVRVSMATVSEGMPAPHEPCEQREPTHREFDAAAAKLGAKDYHECPPFDVGPFVREPGGNDSRGGAEARGNHGINEKVPRLLEDLCTLAAEGKAEDAQAMLRGALTSAAKEGRPGAPQPRPSREDQPS